MRATTEEEVRVKQAMRPAPGSISFVPSVAGLILGGEVVRDLVGISRGEK
jgi:tRNA A37 threonylcarbamoyladenosine dehydratase